MSAGVEKGSQCLFFEKGIIYLAVIWIVKSKNTLEKAVHFIGGCNNNRFVFRSWIMKGVYIYV